MAEQFYTILTKIGKAKIANSTALGTKVNFCKLQVGDSNGTYYNPTEDQTELKHKVWEGNINSISIDENNPNWIIIEVLLPSNVGGFMIREAAILDDEDNVVAIAKYPETYKPLTQDGSSKDILIRTILEVSNTSSVTLKVDPTVILATKKDIEIITSSMDDLGKRITKNEENITNIKSDLDDITTDNKRLTKDKTITGAINELFISASNGKKLISDVVGNPLLATDTFQQQRDKIQTLKNTFASNLSSKKVSASSTEGLSNLINKILNINTGLKYAMGTLNRQNGERTATVSGLSFRPDFVYVNGLNGYIGSSDINPMIFIYSGSKVNFEENINRWGTYGHWNGMNGNPHDFPILHRLSYDIGSIEVTNNSFTIFDRLYDKPSRLKWIAIAIEE
ncbi:tail fiber protein [Clostridium botulinum H04402 065]|uniref:phage tail protein n=1 Tax=Clostridium botulinum TaxID=1491 RepID=UPI0001F84A31|nr:phage tail protein [Clostridium botulinum]CBZ04396.1 tail fiber protein [Clostridium botulinum H04402 065]